MRGLILFAHGARDPEWARPFERIRDRIAAQSPETFLELAYLELMSPSLAEAADCLVSAGADDIVVVPLFMAQGGHLKRDLPKLIDDLRIRHVEVLFRILPPVGEIEVVLAVIAAWIIGELK